MGKKMNKTLIVIVMLIYFLITLIAIKKADFATMLIFGGYTVSNIGLVMVSK